jgi:hypothetical protein
MDDVNPRLQRAILAVVDAQVKDNEPPETRETLDRLVKSGYSIEEARNLIAVVVAATVFDIAKLGQPFDRERYVSALENLPELPFEDPDQSPES